MEDIVLEEVSDAEEDSFRGGINEVVLGGFSTFWEVICLIGEVVSHVCHGECPEEFWEVIPLEEVGLIFILIGGSVDLEVEFDDGIRQVVNMWDILFWG